MFLNNNQLTLIFRTKMSVDAR